MKRELSHFLLGLVVGAALATAGFALLARRIVTAGAGSPVVLKLGHGLDPTHPVHVALVEMRRRLEELSGGSMTIDIYPSGVLGPEVQAIEQLQNGTLAMTKTSTAALEAFIDDMAVFSLPYVFRDEDHYWKVLQGEVGQRLLRDLSGYGLHGLCYYDSGSRNFYTSSKPIRTPEDLEGLKIRVMNSRTSMALVEALGASPTPISWGELYTALAQGTVDGAENNPPSYLSNRHYEVARFLSMDGHSRIPDLVMISESVWNGLGPQRQEWLRRAALDSSDFERELWARKTTEALELAQHNGVEIIYPDEAAFREKCRPLLESYAGSSIGELLRQIGATE